MNIITDRNISDVNRVSYLRQKFINQDINSTERTEYMNNPKGAYNNHSDLNRIIFIIFEIIYTLEDFGYNIQWKDRYNLQAIASNTVPDERYFVTLYENIVNIWNIFANEYPKVNVYTHPYLFEFLNFNYININNIENILLYAIMFTESIEENFLQSGDFESWDNRALQHIS